jgi:hypothetical protein
VRSVAQRFKGRQLIFLLLEASVCCAASSCRLDGRHVCATSSGRKPNAGLTEHPALKDYGDIAGMRRCEQGRRSGRHGDDVRYPQFGLRTEAQGN